MAMELVWPYVVSVSNPSVNDLLVLTSNNKLLHGVRCNQPLLKSAERRMFAPIWSARRHPIYQVIEIADENNYYGLDAIIEEVNNILKTLIPSILTQKHWEMAARNCTKFMKLRKTSFLDPNQNKSFESLDRNDKLSVQMKSFTYKAQAQRRNYINSKFGLNNSSELTRSIPVTFNEAQLQSSESSLKKEEIIYTIETLIGSLNEARRPQFRD
ncbi:hypothetical protein C2G38_2154749 [Gigaspora rosea]|uniref:Uncharacterized protein n=1 Tax=Gigaspora rosea TaxID=44941 RepID=A0A397W4K6_9GLOM|nr:hypothetical protein C2G38_2154749 [Gigaspora rosea]